MFNDTRTILEPAGAVAVAGAKAYQQHYGLTGKKVVAITSGANMDFLRLRLVSGAWVGGGTCLAPLLLLFLPRPCPCPCACTTSVCLRLSC